MTVTFLFQSMKLPRKTVRTKTTRKAAEILLGNCKSWNGKARVSNGEAEFCPALECHFFFTSFLNCLTQEHHDYIGWQRPLKCSLDC